MVPKGTIMRGKVASEFVAERNFEKHVAGARRERGEGVWGQRKRSSKEWEGRVRRKKRPRLFVVK